MKKSAITGFLLLSFTSCWFVSCTQSGKPTVEKVLRTGTKRYYALEINGQLCGFKEVMCDRVLTNRGENERLKETLHLRMNLMRKQIFTKGVIEWFYDTTMQHLVYSNISIDQGNMKIRKWLEVHGDTVRMFSSPGDQDQVIVLSPTTRFENDLYRNYLLAEFSRDTLNPFDGLVFNEMKGTSDEKTYRWIERDTLWLAGKPFNTIHLEESNYTSGEESDLWIDEVSGLIVQNILNTSNFKSYLADFSIMSQLTSVTMDDLLFYRVDKIIPDFRSLSRMKIRAVINSSGKVLTEASLNYPGQQFTGSVQRNVIDGVFEISQPHYEGLNAPGFPYDHPLDSVLQKYLDPEFLIESDDPKIKNKAESILEDGPTDSWDAVKKLSHWVGTEIKGAIPGGGSAIGTLDQKAGECGGHSRLLAAFCRSVGIPARLSIGCMYVPDNGGFFGQHAWTEVYMGDAGWVPVDATIHEFDYIDSGHIRLGESTSFHPKEIEVLDWETETGKRSKASDSCIDSLIH